MDSEQSRPRPVVVLGCCQKNKNESMRVSLNAAPDYLCVDLRVGRVGDDGEFIESRKGFTVSMRRVPWLIDALNAALAEAMRHSFEQGE